MPDDRDVEEIDEAPNLIRRADERVFDGSQCFLCADTEGRELTDEHVLPRWAQCRLSLYDSNLTLLNGTLFRYRTLRVPCCFSCNQSLGRVEERVSVAFEAGAQAVREISRTDLFIWLGKIYYGILFRECSLRFDRSGRVDGSIFPPELLMEMRAHWIFLQAARINVQFANFFPASIFVYDVTPMNESRMFDLRDSLHPFAMMIRLGSVGVIAILQDGGAQREALGEIYNRFSEFTLSEFQFIELTARMFFQGSLLNHIP